MSPIVVFSSDDKDNVDGGSVCLSSLVIFFVFVNIRYEHLKGKNINVAIYDDT